MGKRWKQAAMLAVFTSVLFAGACAKKEVQKVTQVKEAGKPLQIWIAADLHYLSPELTDGGELFVTTIENADGKLTEYAGEILDELLDAAAAQKPDAFIFAGDLTFTGEKKSLQELAEKFEKLQSGGIPVLVIPGNHDIAYPYAYQFQGSKAVAADNISQSEFRSICGKFGYQMALSKDTASFSYVYDLAEDVWLLFLDANTEKDAGKIGEKTLQWAKKQLAQAKERGIKVISISHQNIFPPNKLLAYGYVLNNSVDVKEMLEQYGVTEHFSGHSHLQKTINGKKIQEVITGSVTVSPLHYGIITIDEMRNTAYQAQQINCRQKEAAAWFESGTQKQVAETLVNTKASEEEKSRMTVFAAEINRKYFAGDTEDITTYAEREEWALWQQYAKDTFWYYYLESVITE